MKISEVDVHLSNEVVAAAGEIRLVLNDNYDWLPNSSVDLILTDPPFNIARDTNFHTYEKNTINSYRFDGDKGWDSHSPEGFRELLRMWSAEFHRALRPGGSFAIFCADEYLSDLIFALKGAGLKPRRTLTWRKPNAVPVNRKHMMMSACEYVVLGVKGSKSVFNSDIDTAASPRLMDQEIVALADKVATVTELEVRKSLANLGHRPSVEEIEEIIARVVSSTARATAKRAVNIYSAGGSEALLCIPNYVTFNSKSGGSRVHPTEKPVALLRYLTEILSNPGDLVLDPFAGSASMGEAAMLSQRQAVLVERDNDFFAKGSDRIHRLAAIASNQLI